MSESRWVDQTKFFIKDMPGNGNCAEAAAASILGLSLEDVPKFYDPEGLPSPAYRYWRNLENFFYTQGYWLLRQEGLYDLECLYLASGPSSRGCSHMVVYQNGKLKHDPHPSREGLLRCDRVYLPVPLDPHQFKRGL